MKPFKKTIKATWNIIKETKKNLQEGEPIVYSASIAFFTIFSLPAILIVITLVGMTFFEKDEVRSEIVAQVEEAINPEAGEQVATLLENALEMPDGFWWIIIGILVVVKSATIIFFIMQKALNSVWKVKVKPGVKYLKVMKHRSITLAIVFGLGAVLVLSIFIDTLFVFFKGNLDDFFGGYLPQLVNIGRFLFSAIIVFLFFLVIHRKLPDVKITWKDSLAGSIITSVLFLIGKQIINYILGNIKIIGIYAAAGSLVILLLWVFYSSIILVLGAEVTKAYVLHHGREIKAKSIAVKYRNEIEIEK